MSGEPNGRNGMRRQRTAIARELWWIGLALGLAMFLAFGRMDAYRGIQGRAEIALWTSWKDLTGDLPVVGAEIVLQALYVLALLVFLLGGLGAVWLALAADGSDEGAADLAARSIGAERDSSTSSE